MIAYPGTALSGVGRDMIRSYDCHDGVILLMFLVAFERMFPKSLHTKAEDI